MDERGFYRLLAPLARRLRLMVGRAVISAIADGGKVQAAQVRLLDGEVRDGVEVLMQYGMASNTPGQPEGLYFSVGGDRDHGVMVATADRGSNRPDLAAGETVVYTDEDTAADGHRIHFKNGRVIEIVAGESKIVLTPDGITITAPAFDLVKAT